MRRCVACLALLLLVAVAALPASPDVSASPLPTPVCLAVLPAVARNATFGPTATPRPTPTALPPTPTPSAMMNDE